MYFNRFKHSGTFFLIIAIFLFLPVSSVQAFSNPCPYYGGHVDLEGKIGSQRDIGETSVFIPVACSKDVLVFSDIRFKRDDLDNGEVNIGIGVRRLKETGIIGGYAFFDRRESGISEKHHSQLTLGGEWLAENWEIRANGYAPLTNEVEIITSPGTLSSPFLQGSGIFAQKTASTGLRETPLYGADIEAGFRIPDTKLWLHAGMFSFAGDDTPSLDGMRVRATFRFTDYIAFTAEGQHDDERGRQGWIGMRLTVPFGEPEQKPKGLVARMTASPVRDIDIVTTPQKIAIGSDEIIPVVNVATGTA